MKGVGVGLLGTRWASGSRLGKAWGCRLQALQEDGLAIAGCGPGCVVALRDAKARVRRTLIPQSQKKKKKLFLIQLYYMHV